MSFVNVHPGDLADWLSSQAPGQTCTVLDVREPWELQTSSVQAVLPEGFTFVHIPMQSLPVRVNELAFERPLAVLCHHGQRSMHCAHWLAQHGLEQVANIAGGIHAWAQVDERIPTY
jgi:rhodanese-related sulfurtransferase